MWLQGVQAGLASLGRLAVRSAISFDPHAGSIRPGYRLLWNIPRLKAADTMLAGGIRRPSGTQLMSAPNVGRTAPLERHLARLQGDLACAADIARIEAVGYSRWRDQSAGGGRGPALPVVLARSELVVIEGVGASLLQSGIWERIACSAEWLAAYPGVGGLQRM